MGTWGYRAFENDDASDLVHGMLADLEAELVSFVHRVRFGYAMHYDRARAAAVLLTALAKTGVAWAPADDATAPIVAAAFRDYFTAIRGFEPEHQSAIEADVAEFARTFADPDFIRAPTMPARVDGALRANGAEPAAWSWAREFGFDFAEAWKHAASPVRRTPQIALAVGTGARPVLRAMFGVILREARAATGSRLVIRGGLLALLEALAETGEVPRSMRRLVEQIGKASKAEGEAMLARFHQQRDSGSAAPLGDPDPLHASLFQTTELTRAAATVARLGAIDPYWAGDFVEKLAREARAGEAVATLRAELEPVVLAAAARRAEALGAEISIPIGTRYRRDDD